MAHTEGFATSPDDLLDKIRIWLLTRGWTVDLFTTWTGGYRLHAHKGATYVNLNSFNNCASGYPVGNGQGGTGIALSLGTGFDAGQSHGNQPGAPYTYGYYGALGTVGAACLLGPGPYFSHQFFDDEQGNILLMIERAPGVWRHLIWGDSLDKSGAGSWTGGAYFGSMAPSGTVNSSLDTGAVIADAPPMLNNGFGQGVCAFVRADVDTYTNKWLLLSNYEFSDSTYQKYATNNVYLSSIINNWATIPLYIYLRSRLYNMQDSRAVLLPMQIYVHRDQGGASFLGTVPSVFLSSTHEHGMSIGQDTVIGSETFRQFNGFLVKVV